VSKHRPSRVIARLTSGLGNQLFQLAHGVWLADVSAADLRIDTTWFTLVSRFQPARRTLTVAQLRVDLLEEFRGSRRWLVGVLAAIDKRFSLVRPGLERIGRFKLLRERRDASVSLDVVRETPRLYLDGYWQTREPFIRVRSHLLPMLVPRQTLSEGARRLVGMTQQNPTGFVHVRRGDYITIGGEKSALPLLYYQNAMQKLRVDGIAIAQWLVFSDDLNWTRTNLAFIKNAVFVDYHSRHRDVEDLMIMKACAAGIIANSSYSWWAAALGSETNRPIIAPDRYWPNHPPLAERWSLPHWQHVDAWP
jgi:hypothetical protein